MLKTILKVLVVLVLCVLCPLVLIGLLATLGVALPIVGVVLLIFFPFLLVGIIIGHCSKKTKQGTEGSADELSAGPLSFTGE